jgi:hypothetical protein
MILSPGDRPDAPRVKSFTFGRAHTPSGMLGTWPSNVAGSLCGDTGCFSFRTAQNSSTCSPSVLLLLLLLLFYPAAVRASLRIADDTEERIVLEPAAADVWVRPAQGVGHRYLSMQKQTGRGPLHPNASSDEDTR